MGTFEVVLLVIYIAFFVGLFYLSISDFRTKSVPLVVLLAMVACAFLLNLLAIVFFGVDGPASVGGFFVLYPLNSLLTGLAAGAAIAAIVFATRGKGMGRGDVVMGVVMGFLLGFPTVVVAFYVAVFSALAYGLVLAAIKRKFKGLKMPFIPFMTFGTIIAFLWGTEIQRFFLETLPGFLARLF